MARSKASMKHWTKWPVLVICASLGVWMSFDGSRAFLRGDYLTPASGEYAGQLGPWAQVLSAAGFEPRSPFVKALHLLLGISLVVSAFTLYLQTVWSRELVLATSLLVVWYVPFGTISCIANCLLLLCPRK